MNMSILVQGVKRSIVLAVILGAGMLPVTADDTEIYKVDVNEASGGRPKVLIVFDDSGSMSFMVDQQRPAYDPSADYEQSFSADRIYWSTDGSVPEPRVRIDGDWEDNPSWFAEDLNRCDSSFGNLATDGRFTADRARRWVDSTEIDGDCTWQCPSGEELRWRGGKRKEFWCRECDEYNTKGKCKDWDWNAPAEQVCTGSSTRPGTWQSLSDTINEPLHIECRNDVTANNAGNGSGISQGFPQNNVLTGNEFSSNTDPTVDWGSEVYTFYTAHYLNWYHDDSLEEPRTRLDIAQEVISSLIRTNTGIDFGVMEFNGNATGSEDGGRIVHRIIANMTTGDRQNVVDIVNSFTHAGSTPICESMYEAYRYLGGREVFYGYEKSSRSDSRGTYDILDRDADAERPIGTYDSPSIDCAYTYVILMTDGEPQNDTDANSRIENLTGKSCKRYRDANGNYSTNCLPELAEYMANTDLDDDTTNGNQFGITYTIGFTTDQELLRDAADKGKGQYYTASDAQELTEAFQGAIVSILSTDTTLTSPAVAVDTFARTQSRNEIFYAMFKPGENVDWPGNVKKLKLQVSNGNAVLVDANGADAIDPATGFIKDTAVTFWGSGKDGGSVDKGGVGALLARRDPAGRVIYTDTGTDGALEPFTFVNVSPEAFGLDDNDELFEYFGVSTWAALEQQVKWAQGYDAFDQDGDGDSNEPRSWIMGDVLHSQPLILNYGARGDFTQTDPEMRLVLGTNAGFVHMFGNDDGEEDWAFFPGELVPLLQQRRQNAVSSSNIYGMDLTVVPYLLDVNSDGTINSANGDKLWLFMGMRRGGFAYYALDVSNPDTPALLWSIDPSVSGFEELGQTWSEPVVTRVPGYIDDNGEPKPVLVFGGGYDTNKDATGPATADTVGRGVFVVDAETGALVWSVTPADSSATNLSEQGLLHSVAASVTVLDSNGDEISDRIYFADTGGNIWRIDLPGQTLPDSSQDTWFVHKLARLNGGTPATDRRFFNAPDVVRARYNGNPADVVVIGSGDRANPNATDVDNRIYMVTDVQIAPYTTSAPTQPRCGGGDFRDNRCLLPLTDNSLFDITDNIIVRGNGTEMSAAIAGLRAANGWRLDLPGDGEKALAKSVTLGGKVFMPSFTPSSVLDDVNVCEPLSGVGRLYSVDMFNGDREVIPLGPIIPDTPSVHFGEDGQVRLLLPPGTPRGDTDGDGNNDCEGGVCDIGMSFRAPYPNYWFQEQY